MLTDLFAIGIQATGMHVDGLCAGLDGTLASRVGQVTFQRDGHLCLTHTRGLDGVGSFACMPCANDMHTMVSASVAVMP